MEELADHQVKRGAKRAKGAMGGAPRRSVRARK
jgi:hypothetical protein